MANVLDYLCGGKPVSGPVVLVAAHPDDEVCSAGSRMMRFRDVLQVVHLTDGSPRDLSDAHAAGFRTGEEYARARRRELRCALEIAGIGPGRAHYLGFVDQESGFHLAEAALKLKDLLADLRPGLILCHSYEGGHPDHDSAAFAVHAAVEMLAGEGTPRIGIAEFGSYHARGGRMAVFEFLTAAGCRECPVNLSPQEWELKKRMVDCYVSQENMVRQFPLRFERYREAPIYDFTRPPHEGKLFYEHFSWGMTGPEWREQACSAQETLELANIR